MARGKGAGAGRPRAWDKKYPKLTDQVAIDAEWQEIADAEDERKALAPGVPVDKISTIIDDADGVNTKFAAIILATREIAKNADRSNIETLYDCLEQYLRFCIEHNVRITNAGAYSACGIDRQTVYHWATGSWRGDDPRYKQFAIFIRTVCDEYREMLMAEGKIHPVIGIWWQKNYDGFRDNPMDVVDTGDDDAKLTSAEIAAKYADLED